MSHTNSIASFLYFRCRRPLPSLLVGAHRRSKDALGFPEPSYANFVRRLVKAFSVSWHSLSRGEILRHDTYCPLNNYFMAFNGRPFQVTSLEPGVYSLDNRRPYCKFVYAVANPGSKDSYRLASFLMDLPQLKTYRSTWNGGCMDCGTGTIGLALTKAPSSEFGNQPRGKWTESAGYKLESFIHSPHLLLTFSSHPHPLQIWKLLETRPEGWLTVMGPRGSWWHGEMHGW